MCQLFAKFCVWKKLKKKYLKNPEKLLEKDVKKDRDIIEKS